MEHLVIGEDTVAYTTKYQRKVFSDDLMWVRDLASGEVRGFAENVTPLVFDQGGLAAVGPNELGLFPEAR